MYDYSRDTVAGRVKLSDFILAVTIILATVANFTEISFTFQGINRIAATSVLIYIVTTMTYNHFYTKGKLEGQADTAYKAIAEEYRAERDSVLNGDLIVRVPSFIDYYIKNELSEYRKSILVQYDLSYDDYTGKYLRMSAWEIMRQKIGFKLKIAILRCNHAKPVSVTKADMVASDENAINRSKPVGISGHRREVRTKTKSGVMRLVTTLFSGAIGVDIVLNFSWIAVVTWAIRMLPILTSLVTGQINGYRNITETEAGYKQNQIYLIRLFKEWCSKNSTAA